MRALLHTGWRPDAVFLFWVPDLPPGGSFRIADGVGRLTALAAFGLGGPTEPTPEAYIAYLD